MGQQKTFQGSAWDNIDDFLRVMNEVKAGNWHWARNMKCKYVDLRVDMRDGGCIIKDRDGNRISPQQLAYQYGD